MSQERNYGIDLLRIVSMYMVCMSHILEQGGVLASSKTIGNYSIYCLFETITFCAVDVFAIISGYVANNYKRKASKLITMWFQAFFYSFILTVLLLLCGIDSELTLKEIIQCAFPIICNKFWYFTSYFLLFLSTPLLNKFLFEIDEYSVKKAFLIIVIVFSVIGFIYDPFKTSYGYSPLWLMALYCIGVLLKRGHIFEKTNTLILVVAFFGSNTIMWLFKAILLRSNLSSYISPTVLLNAVILVLLFSRFKLRGGV